MLYGLPSIWNRWLLIVAMSLLPLAFLWPDLMRSAGRLGRRFARRGRDEASRLPRILRPDGPTPAEPTLQLSPWHRCLCLLLAAIFLIGPETFQSLAQADVQYSQLNVSTWGQPGETLTYAHDANGSMAYKVHADLP